MVIYLKKESAVIKVVGNEAREAADRLIIELRYEECTQFDYQLRRQVLRAQRKLNHGVHRNATQSE